MMTLFMWLGIVTLFLQLGTIIREYIDYPQSNMCVPLGQNTSQISKETKKLFQSWGSQLRKCVKEVVPLRSYK